MEADAEEQVEEVLEVPAQEVGAMIGKGGNMVRTVQGRSGAQVKLEQDITGARARITGTTVAVKKALVLLKSMIAFREPVEPGGERLSGPQGPREKGGKFSSMHGGKNSLRGGKGFGLQKGGVLPPFLQPKAQPAGEFRPAPYPFPVRPHPVRALPSHSAQQAWLARAPRQRGAGEPMPGRPLLLAISCCWPAATGTSIASLPAPVLEFPAIAICPITGCEIGRFHRYVGSAKDTAIAAASDSIDAATFTTFPETLADFLDWLPVLLGVDVDSLDNDDFLFVTAGDGDVETAFPMQCLSPDLDSSEPVDEALQNFFCNRWSNLHDVYTAHCLGVSVPPLDLAGMVQHLSLPLEFGKHRLCMDDATDVARVLHTLMNRDVPIGATALREKVGGPTRFVCRAPPLAEPIFLAPPASPVLCVPNRLALVAKATSIVGPPSEALEDVETWLPTMPMQQPFPPLPPMATVPTSALQGSIAPPAVHETLEALVPSALESQTAARRALLAAAMSRGPSAVLREALQQASWAQLDESELEPARQLLEQLEEEEEEAERAAKSLEHVETAAQHASQRQSLPLKGPQHGGIVFLPKLGGAIAKAPARLHIASRPHRQQQQSSLAVALPAPSNGSPLISVRPHRQPSMHETVKEDPYSSEARCEIATEHQVPGREDEDTSPEYEPWKEGREELDGEQESEVVERDVYPCPELEEARSQSRSRSPRLGVVSPRSNAAVALAPWRMA